MNKLLVMTEEDGKTTYLTFMSKDEAVEYAKQLTNGAVEAISGYENSETLIALARFLQERKI